MSKLPKLVNRYTSSPDYFSYEKDYLYEIKQVIKNCPFSSNPFEIVDSITEMGRKGEALNEDIIYWYFLLGSFTGDFPVYYINNNFIDLAHKTKPQKGISLFNPFIENAIFLYPKHNPFKITFSVICCVENSILSYHRFRINQLLHTKHLIKDILNGKEVTKEALTNPLINYDFEKAIYIPDSTNIFVMIANIFLYMSAYKEKGMKIIKEHSTNGVGFKQGKNKLLTPPTIGFSEKEYVENQHRLASISNPNMQGIKKQTHWRRGHWRQYENGKLTWIRPCIINPISEAS